MKYLFVAILAIAAVGLLVAQETDLAETSKILRGVAETRTGSDWTMFNSSNMGLFLYNKRTGSVYKYWFKNPGEETFQMGFQQLPMNPQLGDMTLPKEW